MKLDERFRRSVPWRLPDLYLALALGAGGVVVIAVARAGAGERDRLAEQIPWANLAVGGLIVLCLGCALWVLAGVRATADLRRTVLRQVRASLATSSAPTPAGVAAELVVAGPKMTRYHHPTCALVAGKDVEAVDPAGRRPCGLCQAEVPAA